MTQQQNETRDETARKPPEVLYLCQSCDGDLNCHRMQDMAWSEKSQQWVCDGCFDYCDCDHGRPGITLAAHLAKQEAAAKAEREWRPMSEAPKDAVILAALKTDEGYDFETIKWTGRAWQAVNDCEPFFCRPYYCEPSHWQPLPPPPTP
jgi:hypothetical protein